MSAGQTYGTMGANRRDCPRCFRAGTLAGLREGDAPVLTCTGCRASFRLTWSSVPGMPDTLTQLPVSDPPRKAQFALKPSPASPGRK